MKKLRKIQIGVIGYAGIEEYPKDKAPKKKIYKIAERVGFLLAQNDAIVITGGKGGVMESASLGVKRANGTTVGVVKGNKRFCSNNFTDVEILTGMVADGFDEFLLVMMCDALISIGGGAGTLEEIAIAYRNKKLIIAIKETGGWTDKIMSKYLDERETTKIYTVKTAEEAVKKALEIARKKYV